MSDSSDFDYADFSSLDGGDGGGANSDDLSAECVEEYSVDSDGDIKDPSKAPKVASSINQEKKSKEDKNLTPEEKRKKKQLEKLDKKIRMVTKKHDKEKTIKVDPKLVKNKQKRQEVALMKKLQNRREAKIEKLKK